MSCTKTKFDITAISETRITKQVSLSNNLNLDNYSFEFTPIETSAGGTLLYIANHLSYKCRNGLNIYLKNELEYTYIVIVNPKKSNIIVGVIYRHPSMDLTDFNCNYINKLLENVSKEQNSVFLPGDFNVNLFNYNEHNQANEFLDSLASDPFIPLILKPTRITSHSNTFIDNIFSNVIDTISLLLNIQKILEKLMYKRLYTFLNNNNIIYDLQFGFRQQYSASHALLKITENIRKALDNGNIGCGVFVDLQKSF